MRSTIKTSRIKAVLFTHLHGDHCYGIFGLIKMLSHNGRTNPLWIVGPVGIKRMVLTVLYCSGGWSVDDSGRFRLVFHELPNQRERVIYLEDTEIYIPGLTIHAAPMKHLCMPTYGYIIQESIKPGKLDGEKARALGASGKQLGMLKAGKDVTLENGVVVKSEDVLGTPARPRRVAVLLDTSDASSALPHCHDVDLLIHEATYDDTMRKKAIAHGHSTGVMAAEFANKCNAKRLVLTHFSCRYRSCGTPGLPQVTDLEDEAKKVAKCPVTIACDFKCFSGKMFAPEKVLALQFKELVVLQARENHSKTMGIAGVQGKEVYENREVGTKETMNISNDMSTDNTKDVKPTSITASEKDNLLICSAEACASGEMTQLKTLPNNYQGKNIAEVTS